ncbi:bifunctional folylpolyglutamate synthase/dihydrofolate synthase [Nitriliruptoria bacterium AS10]|nr:bifunctional folylpolyglutamate synthase/dihydrofolate synthase [Salsipaludibacter albus]
MVPDLSRITALMDLLGNPQQDLPTIHVTGTNGKTTTTRMIAALLSELGLTTGTFTSPHLQTVRERIQVGLQPIAEEDFARTVESVQHVAELVDATGEDVTFFELLVAMALWTFTDLPVDVAVVEVGMGGRWDATNVVRGDVAVITPVDVDHRELGDRRATAGEKSGIIKAGGRVVVGEQDDEVLAIVTAAAGEVDAPVRVFDEDFGIEDRAIAMGGQQVDLRIGERVVADVFLPLHGPHQAENAAIALAAVATFLGPSFDEVDDDVVRAGFARVDSPGRMEVVARHPTVVLDGAHNPHGARATALALDEAFTFRNVVLVIGCMADKDLPGIVGAFRDVVDHVVVTAPDSPRAATVAQMAAVAREVFAGTGIAVEEAADVAEALELATGVAGEGDGVVVTGSLMTVGAARDVHLPA